MRLGSARLGSARVVDGRGLLDGRVFWCFEKGEKCFECL
jgi:hypothetical protein